MSANPYGDPAAMRNAIADRLRPFAREHGVELGNLQRQFAYDRLLCRVFRSEPDRWVLKGATAMLARLGVDARHTLDVDLLSRAGDLEEAERALRAAAALDLDDHFAFTLIPGQRIVQGAGVMRVRVVAFLGLKEFASFHVDLVAGLPITGVPDAVPGLVPLQLPGLATSTYSAIRSPTTWPTRRVRSWKRTRAQADCGNRAPASATSRIWRSSPTRSRSR
jgi:Nucleotidyl transferase AbiEii toxin, Type IV TA system